MNKKKQFIWTIISILIAVFTVYAVLSQDKGFSLKEFIQFFQDADNRYLMLALCSMCGYFFYEGLAVTRMARRLGYSGKLFGTVYGAADVYFSAITPSATGGQPASAWFMIMDGIPASATTAILLANLIMYALSMLLTGLFSLVIKWDFFMKYDPFSKTLIVFGSLLMTVLIVLFYMLLRHRSMMYHIAISVLSGLEHLHLVRKGNHHREKLKHTMEEFSECSRVIFGKKYLLLEAFFWNMMQRMSQVCVSFLVFLAAGYSVSVAKVAWHAQNLTALGANCLPVPGAMGVADYLMMDGYTVLLGSDEIAVQMELLSRSFSFYACIITSGIIVLSSYVLRKVRKKC